MLTVEQDGLSFFETEQYKIGELLLRPHGYSQNRPGRIIPFPLFTFSAFFYVISCVSQKN